MRDDDDDVLKGYDLDAWETPAVPEDLADGVIARLAGTDVGAAVPVEPASPRRRAWLVGGVAAAVIAATLGTYAVMSSTRREGTASGSVVAERAQPLTVDGVRAELDAGADVRWMRDGRSIRVEQRAGTAAWRVDGKTALVLAAGEASVEATGASLRVEVEMNGKSVAGSMVAVAMVSVIVYEGQVKVSRAGEQAVIVEPGSTWTSAEPAPVVGGGEAPDEIEIARDPFEGPVPEEDQAPVAAGSGAVVRSCDEVSCVLDNYAGACCAKYKRATPRPEPVSTCDEVSCVLDNYAGACCQKYKQDQPAKPPTTVAPGLDREMISDGIAKAKPQIAECGQKYPAKGIVKISVKVNADGKVTEVVVKETPRAELGACIAHVFTGIRFSATASGGSFTYPFVFDGQAEPAPACDATKLADEGMEKLTEGMHAAALAKFEASLACQSDPKTVKLAYISACNSRNAPKARLYFTKLTAAERDRLEPICVRNQVDLDGTGGGSGDPFASPRPVTCDAEALKARGQELAKSDEHADALEKFEDALRCKPSAELVQLAFTAACKSSDTRKAKAYYPKLSADAQKKLAGACTRNNVPYVDKPSCDAFGYKERGEKNASMGQHAAALAEFEGALRCEWSSDLYHLAFMASCNSQNSLKAKVYYARLTPEEQQRYAVMCIRNKVDYLPDSCDAEALKDEGMENLNMGQFAAGLASFEASLRCRQDPYVTQLAFMASCNSKNAAKAKVYFKQLTPAQQSKFAVMCDRNGISVTDAPASCDAEALKEQGIQQVTMGQHAAALAKFEQSMRCKPDPIVVQLAFMSSCNSDNSPKAKLYYKQLTPAQQSKFKLMCQRTKVDFE